MQEECGTIEDCFDNFQPCPRYGVVVKVTYTTGKSSYGSGYGLTERQTSQQIYFVTLDFAILFFKNVHFFSLFAVLVFGLLTF